MERGKTIEWQMQSIECSNDSIKVQLLLKKMRIYLFNFDKWLYTNMSSGIDGQEACLVGILAQASSDFAKVIGLGLNIISL
jgi:hypothetical protein